MTSAQPFSRGTEFVLWRNIAIPACLSVLARLSMSLTDLMFLGHLGTEYLGAASLANVWMVIVANFVTFAIGGSVNTLCSQAFGAKNYKLVGIWVQIGLVCGSIVCVPVGGLWVATGSVVKVFGFDASPSLAGRYASWSVIGLWPNIMYGILNNYFLSQGIVIPGVVVACFAALCNVLLNVLLIHGTSPLGGSWHGLHFDGSPLATSLANWVLFIGMVVWPMWLRKHHVRTWQPLTLHSIAHNFTRTRMGEFIRKQVMPRAIGALLEQWQLQVVALFAAHIGTAALATHNAFVTLFVVITSAMYGVQRATSVRIGYHLGKSNVTAAKFIVNVSLVVSCVISVVVSVGLVLSRHVIGHMFSHDPEVIYYSSKLAVILAGSYLLASTFFTAIAVLGGQSRPQHVAVAFVVGAWCVCVPVCWPLSHAISPSLLGLWVALTLGYAVTAAIAITAVVRSDWPALAEQAAKRSEAQLQEVTTLLPGDDNGDDNGGDNDATNHAHEHDGVKHVNHKHSLNQHSAHSDDDSVHSDDSGVVLEVHG